MDVKDLEEECWVEEINTELTKANKNYDHFCELNKRTEWPEGSFLNTKILKNSMDEILEPKSLITILNNVEECTEKMEMHGRRYAEIKEVLEETEVTRQLKHLIKKTVKSYLMMIRTIQTRKI